MKKKTALLAATAFLLTSLAGATTISKEKVVLDLEENTVESNIDVETLTTESFNYQTNHPVRNLEAKINGEKADCKVERLTVGADINCKTSLRKNFTVSILYSSNSFVSHQEDVRIFRYSQSIYRPIQDYSFTVILPEGNGVVDSENVTTSVTSPEGGEIGDMNGRRFSVSWNTAPELGDPQSFKVLFEDLQEQPEPETFPYKIIAAVFIFLGIAFLVYRRKGRVAASSVIEELSEDEKMVVEMLQGSDGEMLQKDIVDESEYSKAKISGVVSELVEKGVVSKEKSGRSNSVALEEEFTS